MRQKLQREIPAAISHKKGGKQLKKCRSFIAFSGNKKIQFVAIYDFVKNETEVFFEDEFYGEDFLSKHKLKIDDAIIQVKLNLRINGLVKNFKKGV